MQQIIVSTTRIPIPNKYLKTQGTNCILKSSNFITVYSGLILVKIIKQKNIFETKTYLTCTAWKKTKTFKHVKKL